MLNYAWEMSTRGGVRKEEIPGNDTMKNSKTGFTLVELMVVAIIVAILAAVAIPLMSANKKRAMSTEAEAALGTMRSSMRAMYAQTGSYNVDLNGNTIPNGSAATNLLTIGAGDLDGKYFSEDDYEVTTVGASTYTLTATGTNDVTGVVITLDQGGTFTRTGF